jgi:methylase of polypeptide subunit release factors
MHTYCTVIFCSKALFQPYHAKYFKGLRHLRKISRPNSEQGKQKSDGKDMVADIGCSTGCIGIFSLHNQAKTHYASETNNSLLL